MPLFSRPRRRMFAAQGHIPCIIGLDITAVIGFPPLGVAALWYSWRSGWYCRPGWSSPDRALDIIACYVWRVCQAV